MTKITNFDHLKIDTSPTKDAIAKWSERSTLLMKSPLMEATSREDCYPINGQGDHNKPTK